MTTRSRFRLAAGALIAVLGAIQVSTMLGETQNWDEGIHLAAGYSYLVTGDFRLNPEHPALAKMLCALPVLALNPTFDKHWIQIDQVEAGDRFLYSNRVSPDLILGVARGVTVAMTLLFAATVAWWTRKRFGEKAALIALALFCFDPNITAHGRYVTTDLGAAFFIFLTAALWIDFLEDPSRRRWVLAALALGAAICTKYSALFLIPLVIASGIWKRQLKHALGTVAIAGVVVLAVYAPEVARGGGEGLLIDRLSMRGPLGKPLVTAARIFQLPVFNYLAGLDVLSQHDASGQPTYLYGMRSEFGWWYYFPLAMAVKTQLAALAAIAAGLVLLLRLKTQRFAAWCLFGTAAVFMVFCMRSHINIGLRHVLPVYAFLYVLAGAGLARYRWAPWVLVAVAAIESLSVYPHYTAYFNAAAGGPAHGPDYLLDSNIDWGQDIKKLGRYLKENNIDEICFTYFGHADHDRYGVRSREFPKPPQACDGWGAVSVTPLYGLYDPNTDWSVLRKMTPAAKVGYSIYVYDLRKKK